MALDRKGGILNFIRTIAREMPNGINLNAVATVLS